MTTTFRRSTLALSLSLLLPAAAWSQVSLSISVAPPPLPYYVQPPIPGDGYIWTPGYWAWDPAAGEYEWVPGTWVQPPQVGFLWTPGWWGFVGGVYSWHRGYWGPHVGYYGGIHYGYGYTGHGYEGGHWDHGHFAYNRAVNNLPEGRVHNFYNRPVPQRAVPGRESFNGPTSHWHSQPTAAEHRYEAAQHAEPTHEQVEHEHRAMTTPEQRMSANHGMPPTAATAHPGGFGEPGVERGRTESEMRDVHQPHETHAPAGGREESGHVGGGRPEGGHPQGGHAGGGRGEHQH